MKRNSFWYIFIFVWLFCSCSTDKDTDDKIFSYIETKGDFKDTDTCYVDLKEILQVDYDTMYVFGEYTQLQGVRLILGIQNYDGGNLLLPKGFLVEDSHKKMILIKNRKIVYEDDFKSPYFDDGTTVEKTGIFDGQPFTHVAKIYTSSRFLVIRKGNRHSHFYIFKNVLQDGSILPRDVTGHK